MAAAADKPVRAFMHLLIALPFLAAGAGLLTTTEGDFAADTLTYLLGGLCLTAGALILLLPFRRPKPGTQSSPTVFTGLGKGSTPKPVAVNAAPETAVKDFQPLRPRISLPRRSIPAKPGPGA